MRHKKRGGPKCTHFIVFSSYLASIEYLTEAYICVKIAYYLEISLITVIYKRIGKFWYIKQSELNNSK